MAETVHLYLKSNGSDVQGESTQTSLGRANSIECLYFESGVITAREAGTSLAVGRRQHQPILIRKRIDKSTPMIAKALVRNESIDGVFKFFRPQPTGDGTTEQFYTVKIEKGRVASQRMFNPDALVPARTAEPAQEEITFVFHTITWTYTDGGIEWVDKWDDNA